MKRTYSQSAVLMVALLLLSGCVSSYQLYEGDPLPESDRSSLRIMIPQGLVWASFIQRVDERTRDKKNPTQTLWDDTDLIALKPGLHSVEVKTIWWRDRSSFTKAITENTQEEDDKVTTITELSFEFLPGHEYVIQCYECKEGEIISKKVLERMSPEELAELEAAGIAVGSIGGGILFWTWPLLVAYEVIIADFNPDEIFTTERYIWMTDATTGDVVWSEPPQVSDH